MNQNPTRVSRVKFALVLAAFLVPLFIAMTGYYFFPSMFTSSATINHATLIHPAISLKSFVNPKLDSGELTLESLQRKWTVVHRLSDKCSEDCAISLYNTRQTRLALGRDGERIRRILLGANIDAMKAAANEHPDMMLVLRNAEGLDQQLKSVVEENTIGPDDALLIDPLGNVMLTIPAGLDPSDLLKDLKKLLKLSKIG